MNVREVATGFHGDVGCPATSGLVLIMTKLEGLTLMGEDNINFETHHNLELLLRHHQWALELKTWIAQQAERLIVDKLVMTPIMSAVFDQALIGLHATESWSVRNSLLELFVRRVQAESIEYFAKSAYAMADPASTKELTHNQVRAWFNEMVDKLGGKENWARVELDERALHATERNSRVRAWVLEPLLRANAHLYSDTALARMEQALRELGSKGPGGEQWVERRFPRRFNP